MSRRTRPRLRLGERRFDLQTMLIRFLLFVLLIGGLTGASGNTPAQGFYHPDATGLFDSLDDYLAWYRSRPGTSGSHAYDPAKLTVGVYFHIVPYQQKNHAHIDALVRAVERRGQNVIVLTSRGSPKVGTAFLDDGQPAIDVLLFRGERLDQRDREAGLAEARRLGVPILGAMSHHGADAAKFAELTNALHPELTPFVVNAERDGLIEPMVISGKGARREGRTFIEPFPAQVEWRVDRALAWARLHRAPNRQKRVVFTYWSEGAGKANVGGDPDDFLDVQASLVRLLAEMRKRGYDVGSEPLPDRDTLARRMALEASNVGSWAPGELASRVARREVALAPAEVYRGWFDALPESRRREIVEMWGPPPGNVMVHTDAAGQRFIVIPRLELGNVLVAPHPDWGYLQDEKALMSTGALPPHHQYVAFFLWLQREWRVDAWVSLFSNIVLQPGKAEGPAADDHVAQLLGALPHIHPERLGTLRALLARYSAQPSAATQRADTESLIRKQVTETGVDRALQLDAAQAPIDDLVRAVEAHMHDLERAQMPLGTKVLGDAPTGKSLADMVAGMLGRELREALTALTSEPAAVARRLAAAVLLDGLGPADALRREVGRTSADAEAELSRATEYAERLRAAPREVAGILEALEGRRIEPGPMDEPFRRPDALPPGRSLYGFDQAAMPTPEAEAAGVRQAEALIAAHRAKHGDAYPTRLAFVIWSSEIARTHGVTEAQVLHLLGTRAVRNARGEITGVELIPRDELGRPRVDVLVTTSGTYRDHYRDKIDLMAEATRLAAGSPEPDNPVAAAARVTEDRLRASGEAPARAAALASARVFAPAPGAYSPSIQFLAKSGDARGDDGRMADLYTSRMSHAYGGGLQGEAARPAFEQGLARVDAATLPRSSHVNGLLDHPMSAGFLGGLNLAARAVTGHDVDLYVSDLRDPDATSIDPAARALQTELRTRYLNPRWLAEMKAHGYDGARQLMFMTDHLDLWDSTATDMASSRDWAEVKAVYVDDQLRLDLDRAHGERCD